MISPYAEAVVVPAAPILERIGHYGAYERGVVIPNGIDVKRFAEARGFAAGELPWPAGARVVGYVGRFDQVKNLPLLLRAFARLVAERGECHLALVGYGPEEGALRRLSTSLHIAPLVHFVEATEAPERWYKSFTCHCLPSVVEGFGLTLVEAIAAGIPVVAMKTEVTGAIVREGIDGLLVERADDLLLTKALQMVMEESAKTPLKPTLPQGSVESGVTYVQRQYSIAHMVELYEKFLKNFSFFTET